MSTEVAPPSEPSGRWQRTGYLALAASGLVLSTAFGALAQVAAPEGHNTAGDDSSQVSTGNDGQAPDLDNPAPGATTQMVDGRPVPGEDPERPGSPSVTTSISVGPDGTPTRVTTTRDNPQRPPQSPGDGQSSQPGPTDGRPTDTRPTTTAPPPTSDTPPPTTTPPPTSSEPPPTSDSSPPPTGSSSSDPTSSGSGSATASS